ncbi:MAG: U32 family peptidase [Victivallales bacterium]|nr:U32 family peptidase [Victivallales bacterium]
MFITFGLDTTDTPARIKEYVKYGAEEFFAGFIPRNWLSKYGWEVCPNRRPLGHTYNFLQVNELQEVAKAIHDCGARLNLAINAHDNGSERLPYLRSTVETMEQFNPDGYIVADPAVMFSLKAWGINKPIHLSTGVGCFSSESVRFFCKQFKIRRVVIPRKLTISEIKKYIDNLKDINIEFEVMIIGYRCYFNDEDCHSVHSGSRRNLCGDVSLGQPYITRRFPDNWKDVIQSIIDHPNEAFEENSPLNEFRKYMAQELPTPPRVYDDPPFVSGFDAELPKAIFQNCGLCAIKPFRDMGVHCFKVPLRGTSEFKLESLKIVHKVMTHENPTPEYCRSIINSPSFCDALSNCYYWVPEAHQNKQ